jgi:hypothetical protein
VKSPFSFDVVSIVVPLVALTSVTVAPGITPPDVSRTDPTIDPLVIWAASGAAQNDAHRNAIHEKVAGRRFAADVVITVLLRLAEFW